MIAGGNATIFVSNVDSSIHFYTEILGLKLTNRFGNDWATVSAGDSLTIGIHPASPRYAQPGTKGSVMLGMDIDIPLEKAVSRLAGCGVKIKGSVDRSEAGNFVHLEDPDGNEIYLWEKAGQVSPASEMIASVAE